MPGNGRPGLPCVMDSHVESNSPGFQDRVSAEKGKLTLC